MKSRSRDCSSNLTFTVSDGTSRGDSACCRPSCPGVASCARCSAILCQNASQLSELMSCLISELMITCAAAGVAALVLHRCEGVSRTLRLQRAWIPSEYRGPWKPRRWTSLWSHRCFLAVHVQHFAHLYSEHRKPLPHHEVLRWRGQLGRLRARERTVQTHVCCLHGICGI